MTYLDETKDMRQKELFPYAVCVVDGSEFSVYRGYGLYSGEKKKNILFITLLNGQIKYVSNAFQGACDQRD